MSSYDPLFLEKVKMSLAEVGIDPNLAWQNDFGLKQNIIKFDSAASDYAQYMIWKACNLVRWRNGEKAICFNCKIKHRQDPNFTVTGSIIKYKEQCLSYIPVDNCGLYSQLFNELLLKKDT